MEDTREEKMTDLMNAVGEDLPGKIPGVNGMRSAMVRGSLCLYRSYLRGTKPTPEEIDSILIAVTGWLHKEVDLAYDCLASDGTLDSYINKEEED